MKLKSALITAGVCLIGLSSVSALADDATNNNQVIDKLNQRTELLQNEVQQLQTELKALKKAKVASTHKAVKSTAQSATASVAIAPAAVNGQVLLKKPLPAGMVAPVPVKMISDSPLYIGGTPIVISPFMGVRSAFNASDLITNLPYINTDLGLLQDRQKLQDTYSAYGLPDPNRPMLEVSGQIQATATQQKPYTGRRTSDVDLTDGEVDFTAIVNSWVTGFMNVFYDNSPSNSGEGPRASNSRFYMQRGFITIGNLNQSPFYATVGQLYVPFGQYSSSMIANPMTKTMARIKTRAVVLGFDKMGKYDGINAQLFTFKGDSKTSANSSTLNQLGGNVSFTVNQSGWNSALGVGYITNMADSDGMQTTGASGTAFKGFGETNGSTANSQVLIHQVPAVDVNGSLSFGPYSLVAEYVEATRSFATTNMSYNNTGAQPAALNAEFSYNTPIWDRPTVFAVGYGQTRDALALLLPKQRYVAVVNASIWKDTIESLELRHDVDYSSSASASGQGSTVSNGTGRASNTLTAQLTLFF